MPRIKAVSILDACRFVLERFGEEGQQRVLAELSPTDREVLYADSLISVIVGRRGRGRASLGSL